MWSIVIAKKHSTHHRSALDGHSSCSIEQRLTPQNYLGGALYTDSGNWAKIGKRKNIEGLFSSVLALTALHRSSATAKRLFQMIKLPKRPPWPQASCEPSGDATSELKGHRGCFYGLRRIVRFGGGVIPGSLRPAFRAGPKTGRDQIGIVAALARISQRIL